MTQSVTDKHGVKRYLITLEVNGDEHSLMVKGNTTLTNALRDQLELTGTKKGCELGDCGSCTVLIDGKPVDSCMVLAVEADGREITTVEGVAQNGKLDAIQEAMVNYGAVQCGYCTPGMVLSAKALLTRNPHPTEHQVREAIAGNLCRCTGYVHIVEAVLAAAEGRVVPEDDAPAAAQGRSIASCDRGTRPSVGNGGSR
ncbi:MAG: (2Fe-2S)-binding protein [Deferrisomatales bacterium]|nr:(2Fe-2S)-binding protein [Deferrisomatales bacterium]